MGRKGSVTNRCRENETEAAQDRCGQQHPCHVANPPLNPRHPVLLLPSPARSRLPDTRPAPFPARSGASRRGPGAARSRQRCHVLARVQPSCLLCAFGWKKSWSCKTRASGFSRLLRRFRLLTTEGARCGGTAQHPPGYHAAAVSLGVRQRFGNITSIFKPKGGINKPTYCLYYGGQPSSAAKGTEGTTPSFSHLLRDGSTPPKAIWAPKLPLRGA